MKVLRDQLHYMGELGFVEFPSSKIIGIISEKLGCWIVVLPVLKQTSTEFVPEGRILWVEIEGVPFKLWSKNTFKKLLLSGERFLTPKIRKKMVLYEKICIYSKLGNNIYENFKVIFRGKVFVLRAKEIPGWVPEFADEFDDDDESEEGSKGDTANSHGAPFNFDDAEDVDKVPETELDDPLEQNRIHRKIKNILWESVNDVTSPRIVEKEQNEQKRINNYNGSKDEMSGFMVLVS
ncbi:hypothetical protein Tco_1175603 [Tanacetum coccineum]